jgi:excisionase family DNA binding protein
MHVKETRAQAAEKVEPKLSSRHAAARQLDISVRTLERLSAKGALKSVPIGSRRLIRNDSLDALIRGRG